ncbi:ribosomal protein S18 acetylase RimI-like enzyme [Amorphus suaedae]
MIDIRPAEGEGFSVAVDWAAAEGWNPGLDDLGTFRAADAEGLLLGFVDGRPVASISAVRYGDRYGFLGFYIVVPEARGKGYGMAIWNAAMARFGDRVVGLDGVVAQQDNYRKSGFVLAGRNVRFTGPAEPPAAPASGVEVRPLAAGDVAAVLAFDRAFFPADRSAFTQAWVAPAAGVRRSCRLALRDGRLVGYGVIRACRAGHKIGPLFAADPAVAEALFSALAATVAPGSEISLDVPEANREGVALAERHGLAPSFETARMYAGPAPDLPTARTFGITTFELG